MTTKVPVGLGRDGEPIYVNLEFLDGTRGAHVSISGHLRRRDQDQLRPVPAALAVHAPACSAAAGRQREGADLLRQGRGPAVPRPAQHPARRRPPRRLRPARPGGEAVRLGRVLRPAHPGRPDRPTARHRADVGGERLLVDAGRVLPDASCCRTSSPTSRTSATSTRWSSTRSPPGCARDAAPAGRDGAVAVDGTTVRTWPELVDLIADKVTDDATRADWAGPVTGVGTDQRVHPPAPVVGQSAAARSCAATSPRPSDARTIDTANQQVTVIDLHNLPERAQRFVVGVVIAARDRPQGDAPGRAACCSP